MTTTGHHMSHSDGNPQTIPHHRLDAHFMAKTVMTGTSDLVQPRFSYFNVTSVIAATPMVRNLYSDQNQLQKIIMSKMG